MIQISIWSLPSLLCFIFSGALFLWMWNEPGSLRNRLLLTMVGYILLWSMAHYMRTVLVTVEAKLVAHVFLLPISLLIASTYFLFGCAFARIFKTWITPAVWVMVLCAVSALLLTLNVETRPFFLQNFSVEIIQGFSRSSIQLGVGGQFVFGVSLLFAAAGVFLFIYYAMIDSASRFEAMLYALLGIALLPSQQYMRFLWVEDVTLVNLAPVAVVVCMLMVVLVAVIFEDRLRQLSNETILDELPDALFLMDESARVVDVNRQAMVMVGGEDKEVRGQPLFDLIGIDPRAERMGREEDVVLERVRSDKRFDITLSGLERSDGRVLMFACVLEDRTGFRSDLDRLRALSDEMLVKVDSVTHINQAKQQFLARCSDTMREPLIGVVEKGAVLKELLRDRQGVLEASTFVDEIDKSARHLLDLVEHINVFEQTGREAELVLAHVDVAGIAHEVVRQFQPLAQRKQITLEAETANAPADSFVDAQKFRQIVVNLVSNAIKFTTEGGSIQVQVRQDVDAVVLQVSDDGIGIEASDLERIFVPFEQVDNTYSRAQGGTGLGLALVQRLVKAHDGSIRVESESGSGTRFIVELPMVEA